MSISTKASLRTLEIRLKEAESQIAALDPELFNEWVQLKRLIAQRRGNPTDEFAAVKTPREAIDLCLTERNSWMSKAEIADRLEVGGYITSSAERWKINSLLNYHSDPTKGDTYQRYGDTEGWEMLIGRKGWAKPKS
jgi:hypothetical protein